MVEWRGWLVDLGSEAVVGVLGLAQPALHHGVHGEPDVVPGLLGTELEVRGEAVGGHQILRYGEHDEFAVPDDIEQDGVGDLADRRRLAGERRNRGGGILQ